MLNIGIGIVRTKVFAVLLGPAGFGLMGLYSSIVDLAQSIAGMGVNSSGVRQIAESVGTGDDERIARTVVVLRKTSVVLGILGAVLLVIFSKQVSTVTFGSDQNAVAVAVLSLAVFFRILSANQGALIQGMRRIGDLARMGVLSAFFGTIIGIPFVYFFREKGVAPALVGLAAMMLFFSWWYSRNVKVQSPAMTVSQIRSEAGSLLKLGFVFMASGFLMMGAAYAVRIIITRKVGLDAAGFYQAAWTLGGLYVGFILQAMGADFYPRLTGVFRDNNECTRLVNEQTLISLLLAGPGVIATLSFAPLVITVFYSAKFLAAVDILRWICLGMALRVITWPMGYIIIAKGEKKLFFLTELAWTIVNISFSWICVSKYGLNGAGIAFFGSYVFHGLIIYPIVNRISGFNWSLINRYTGLLFISFIAIVFCGFYFLSLFWATTLGTLSFIISSVYSVRTLLNLVPLDRIPPFILKLFRWLGLAKLSNE